MRRLRELEAEDEQMRRQAASGRLSKQMMPPGPQQIAAERAEMDMLTEHVRSDQVLVERGFVQV